MVLSLVNISQAMDNPFAPLFTEKRVLKLVEPFPGQFWTINSQKRGQGQALGGLLLQMQNISF